MIETRDTRVPVKRWATDLDEATEGQIRDIANLSVSRAVAGNGARGGRFLVARNQSAAGRAKSREIGSKVYTCEICGAKGRGGFFLAQHRKLAHGNHKVVGVQALRRRADVYCLQVENYHNFALAAGVFVHNCGMTSARFNLSAINFDEQAVKRVMGEIRKVIPLGFSKHNDPQPWFGFFDAPDIPVIQRELANARLSLGTLGGGNHFIEFERDPEGGVWCTIHSGSRNFGLRVASEYHVAAQKFCERNGYQLTNDQLAYLPLDSVLGHEYKTAMNYAVVFASANRAQMMQWVKNIVAQETGAIAQFELDVRHNYASEEWVGNDSLWVHRKGAVFAGANVMVIIPGSMGSPTYIGRGLGNADALNSCSHGAGRRMGRGQAKRALDLGIEQERMRGIVHGLRSVGDLDEAPSAYKDIDEVMAAQTDLVTPTIKLAPLANIKG